VRQRVPQAEVLTIGDELLRGEIVDSNKSLLSERLLDLDIETRFHVSVRDDPSDMRDAFRRAAERSDVVLVSGGLGPTRDDLTMQVLAETFGRKLVLHQPSLDAIRTFFRSFGREMAEINAKQAYFPEGAEVLPNPIGTAPGAMLEEGDALFFCMPGVPRELRRMLEEQVLPRVAARRGVGGAVRATLLRTFGIGESSLDEMLRTVPLEPGVDLGFRTAFPENYVRIVARGAAESEAGAKLERARAALRAKLGPLCYGEGEEETLERVVGRLLAERGRTVAVAESCTGGLIGERFTSVPGSSAWFLGGVIAYSNEAKVALLGVSAEVIAREGAVSEAVARSMAEGARRLLGADLAVAATGISGPDGGTPEKPVGLVYVGLASEAGAQVRELFFPFDRLRHRGATAHTALEWIRRTLLGLDLELPRSQRPEGARSKDGSR
jgi:competence/damage-inducible protein CinA-like protein